ncbi:MAG: tyrosine-type recombinase/integrase [Armatimonadetes bacterium]|nr:tyrosine-type recombinase/integrase [Armatimonadota bacterium]MDI9586704.1 tyrosine-type recombinase/integrase [Acidobacteriota bacterium]
MDTAIRDFVLYLEAERGYSPNTCRSYRSDLRLFREHMDTEVGALDIESVTTQVVRAWIVQMKGAGLTNSTIARRVHALRSFWHYLADNDLVDQDPLRRISAPKKERKLPQYLRADELREILDAAQRHPVASVAFRDYAIMAVMIYTGIRKAELIGLRLADVDLVDGLLRVHGKGGKWRVVPLADEAAQAVSDWLEFRRTDCRHDYLFTTTRGNRIHPSRMQRIWSSILKRSGITREGVSLHTLRHSAATLLLQSGRCDILQIQQLLGHSRLDTTAIYLHVEPGDLRDAMRDHPLGTEKGGAREGL